MGMFTNLFRQNPAPRQAPTEEAQTKIREQFQKRINGMSHEQMGQYLSYMRRHHHVLTDNELTIVRTRLESLASAVSSPSHEKIISESQANLSALQERFTKSQAAGAERQTENTENNSSFGRMLGAGLGATILSWFGFNVARRGLFGGTRATASTGWRGLLGLGRTGISAIEFGTRHPIITAMLGGLGAGATKQVVDFVNGNRNGLIQQIEAAARERGVDPIRHAEDIGHRVGDFIRTAGSSTAETFARGIVWVCGGSINPETGAITLPHSSLRPDFIVAYQAAHRSRFESNKSWRNWVQGWEISPFRTREENMLAMQETAFRQSGDRARHVEFLANEADALYKRINDPRTGSAERAQAQRRLDPILQALNNHERLRQPNVQALRSGDLGTGARLQNIASQAAALRAETSATFPHTRDAVHGELATLEQNIRNGTNIPVGQTIERHKQSRLNEINTKIVSNHEALRNRSLNLGNEFADTLTKLSRSRMDTAGGGTIDATRRIMENAGYKFAQVPGGRWVLRSVVGYSMLPLAMETASALSNTLEGNVRERRLRERKNSGQALTEQEEQELKKLEEQWSTVGKDVFQVAGGFIPVVGEGIDAYGAITGKDLNGRELSTSNRITMGVMAGLGTGSLLLAPFTLGGSVVAWRVVRGGVGAGRALSRGTRNVEASVRAVQQSTRFIEGARATGASLSTVQRAAMTTRSGIQTARGAMQVYTYGMLGYSLGAGAYDFVTNSRLSEYQEKTARAFEGATDAVISRVPGHRPHEQETAPVVAPSTNQAPPEEEQRPQA